MRIGFFTNNYLPRPSGVAHAVENLRIELERLGHDIYVFAPKYTKRDKENEKLFRYKSIRLSKNFKAFHSNIPFPHSLKIKKRINSLKLDIIHSHHPYILGKTALKYSQELNLPIVFTSHTLYNEYFSNIMGGLGSFISSLTFESITKYANKCNILTVPTQGIKKTYLEAGVIKDVRVVPSGIDIDKFQETSGAKIREKYNIKKNEYLLMTVGRLTYEKNISFLIEAFQKISKSNQKVKLLIIGEGLDRRSLMSLAQSLNIQQKVIFAKRISYKKLPAFYAAADLFVYASNVDTQGLALCEAMAASLPIISTNQAHGPKSLVKNNKIGYLINPDTDVFARKVLQLINDSNLRQRFSHNAKEEAKKYDRRITAHNMEKIYIELLENGKNN
jgi:1,2-diacylglycerol 3-alpha-glucosyltransferase